MDNGTCTKCKDMFKPITTAGVVKCTSYSTCNEGQFLNSTGNCVDGTIDNCLLGDVSPKTCKSCQVGYFPESEKCSPCQNGCHQCSKDSKGYLNCTDAGVEFWDIITNKDKNMDVTGYLCDSNCAQCNRDKVCIQCMPNFLITMKTEKQRMGTCTPIDQCEHVVKSTGFWCKTEKDLPTFGSKVAVSFMALIAVAFMAF